MLIALRKHMYIVSVLVAGVVSFFIAYTMPQQSILIMVCMSVGSIVGIVAIGLGVKRALYYMQHQYTPEKKFATIKTIRELLQLEPHEFKEFLAWLYKSRHYKIYTRYMVGERGVILHVLYRKEHMLVIGYQSPINRMMTQHDVDHMIANHKKDAQTRIMVITTGDFDEDALQKYIHNTRITLVSGPGFEKMIGQKKAEDPFV